MKNLAYGVLACIIPATLVIYGFKFISGNTAMFFGCFALGLMAVFTHGKFKAIGEDDRYRNLQDAFCVALIGNAIIAGIYLFLTFVGAKVFYAEVARTLLEFPPLMFAGAYSCWIVGIFCIIRLFKNKWLDIWQKTHTTLFLVTACCIMFYCLYTALKPYGAYVSEQVESTVFIIMMLSICGIVICGYKITVYDVNHS